MDRTPQIVSPMKARRAPFAAQERVICPNPNPQSGMETQLAARLDQSGLQTPRGVADRKGSAAPRKATVSTSGRCDAKSDGGGGSRDDSAPLGNGRALRPSTWGQGLSRPRKREGGISSLAVRLERGGRMRRFRAVAWDVDGTLVDSEPLNHRALLAASRRWGVDLSDLPDRHFRGIHAGDVWTILRRRMPEGLAQVEWLAAINAYYIDNSRDLKPLSRVIETVATLAARRPPDLRIKLAPLDHARQSRSAGPVETHRLHDRARRRPPWETGSGALSPRCRTASLGTERSSCGRRQRYRHRVRGRRRFERGALRRSAH